MTDQNRSRQGLNKSLEHAKYITLADEVADATLEVMIVRHQVRVLAVAVDSLGKALGIRREPSLTAEFESIEQNLRAQVSAFEEALAGGDLDAAAAIPHMPPLEHW